jgi:2-dehydro-3-deoxy-D-arabinonate dehydratase
MQIVRVKDPDGEILVGIVRTEQEGFVQLPNVGEMQELLRLPLAELHTLLGRVTDVEGKNTTTLLAPIDGGTEVWAAGVTYKRSMSARMEESDTPDVYAKVYDAERPELFFKGVARRVAGPNEVIAIRADSNWDVPEPELVLVVNAYAEIIGYTIGNDVSSRSIEGENPLYLPQAKVYAGSCALGPGITPVWEVADPYSLSMHLSIERAGQLVWKGESSTSELKRRLNELVEYLFREDEYPEGVFLCTGTALVPDYPFSLEANDRVEIEVEQLGILCNPVVRGKGAWLGKK